MQNFSPKKSHFEENLLLSQLLETKGNLISQENRSEERTHLSEWSFLVTSKLCSLSYNFYVNAVYS